MILTVQISIIVSVFYVSYIVGKHSTEVDKVYSFKFLNKVKSSLSTQQNENEWFNNMFSPHKRVILGPIFVEVNGIGYEMERGFHWTVVHNFTLYSHERNMFDRDVHVVTTNDLFNSLMEHYYLLKQEALSPVETTYDFITALYAYVIDLDESCFSKLNVNELIPLANKVTDALTTYYVNGFIPPDYNPFGLVASSENEGVLVFNEPDNRLNCFDGFDHLDSFLFFVAYHDANSFHSLNGLFSDSIQDHHFIFPVHIASTVFFEYILFRDFFTSAVLRELQQSSLQFVGISSHKTLSLFDSCCSASVDKYLAIARRLNVDVLPLIRSKRSLMKSAVLSHGMAFRTAWDALLLEMGYSLDTIRQLDDISPFYRNSMLITPQWLERLANRMRQAIDIVTHDETIRELFAASAGKYRGVRDTQMEMDSDVSSVAMRVFGTPYYQLFPFVFERLPVFFLIADGARVCQHCDECYYNTRN